MINGDSDAGARIYGTHAGIDIKGTYSGSKSGLGRVVNYGTIYAPSGTGVYLRGGGTVENYGSIEGHGFGAMVVFEGVSISGSVGSVTNGVSGRIAGGIGVLVDASASATVTNLGEIQGLGEFGLGVSITTGTITNGATGVAGASIDDGVRFTSTAAGSGLVNFGFITRGAPDGLLVGPITPTPPHAYDNAVLFAGAGSVGNYGTITGKAPGGAAVYQQAGGTVVNGPGGATGALISGYGAGVWFASTALGGTIVNYGTIRGIGAGVDLGIGGAVTNRGTIIDTYNRGSGVNLGDGGSISNWGLISAHQLGVFANPAKNPSTVVNHGTIQSSQTATVDVFAPDGFYFCPAARSLMATSPTSTL